MDTNIRVPGHNLRRVVSPDTPKIAREDKVNRPATYYACSCDVPMTSSYSRRQARRMHKLHRVTVIEKAMAAVLERLGVKE